LTHIYIYIHINFNVCINYAFDGKLSHNAAQREQSAPKARAPPSNCGVVNYQVGGSSSSSAALRAAAPPTQTRPPPPPAHSSSHQRWDPNGSTIPPWRQPVQPRPPPPWGPTVQELQRTVQALRAHIAKAMASHQSHLPVPTAPSIGEVVPLNTPGLTNVSLPPTPFIDLLHMIPPTLPAATTPASTLPAPHPLPAAITPTSKYPAPHPAQTAPTPEQALPEPATDVCSEEKTLRSILLGHASSMPAPPVIPRPPQGPPPASVIPPPTQPTREPAGTHAVRSQSTAPLYPDDECTHVHHIDDAEAAARAERATSLRAYNALGRRRGTLRGYDALGRVQCLDGRRRSSSSSLDDECQALLRPTTRPRPAKAVIIVLACACTCHPQINACAHACAHAILKSTSSRHRAATAARQNAGTNVHAHVHVQPACLCTVAQCVPTREEAAITRLAHPTWPSARGMARRKKKIQNPERSPKQ
jgi:hypothetical protein